MQIRPLPEIDLARIAPQSEDIKRKSLEKMKGGFSTFSYKPVRACFGDIFNIQTELKFGEIPATSWEKIVSELCRRCKSDEELKYNKLVAKSLYDFAMSKNVKGRREDFFPFSMGLGHKVTFWTNMILTIDGVPKALFIDPRSTKNLTADGRKFAFSMMHERIRTEGEDFAGVVLTIAQFDKANDGRRKIRLYTDEGIELYSREELELLVASTYNMWREVLEGRENDTRGKATGTGPLI